MAGSDVMAIQTIKDIVKPKITHWICFLKTGFFSLEKSYTSFDREIIIAILMGMYIVI